MAHVHQGPREATLPAGIRELRLRDRTFSFYASTTAVRELEECVARILSPSVHGTFLATEMSKLLTHHLTTLAATSGVEACGLAPYVIGINDVQRRLRGGVPQQIEPQAIAVNVNSKTLTRSATGQAHALTRCLALWLGEGVDIGNGWQIFESRFIPGNAGTRSSSVCVLGPAANWSPERRETLGTLLRDGSPLEIAVSVAGHI